MISYQGTDGWRILSGGKATQCLRKGLACVGRRWKEEGRGAGGALIPEEIALLSGTIRGGHETGREKSARGSDSGKKEMVVELIHRIR